MHFPLPETAAPPYGRAMDDQLPTKIQQYYVRDFCEDDRLRSRSAQSAVELGRVQSLPWLPRRHFHVSGELAAELS